MTRHVYAMKSRFWVCMIIGGAVCGGLAQADDFEVVLPGLTVTNGDAANILDGGDTLIVQGTGSIIVNGPDENATEATGENNLIRNLGTLDASGDNGDGIFMQGANSIAINTNIIQATGPFGNGIAVLGAGSTIVNTGDVATTGAQGYGLSLNSGTGTLLNAAGATVTTTGDGAGAIIVDGNDTSTENAGAITTSGANAVGIEQVGDNAVVLNLGTIETSGDGADAILASGDFVSIINSFGIATTAMLSEGIRADGGFMTVANEAGAILVTSGDFSDGIWMTGENLRLSNAGMIGASGFLSDGLRLEGIDGTIANSGLVSISGDQTHGIIMASDGGSIENAAGAEVLTSGFASDGIRGSGSGIRIRNDGILGTSGDQSWGIELTGEDGRVLNSGQISTAGTDAFGINLTGSRNEITHSGSITTTGDGADGINLLGDDQTVTISGMGTMSVGGMNANGVFIDGDGATILFNDGFIFTDGIAASGIRSAPNSDGMTIVMGTDASISTVNAGGRGILVSGDGIRVDAAGTIVTSGDAGTGIGTGGPNATVLHSGSIRTTGSGANGLDLGNGGSFGTLTNSGLIRTEGATSHGISVLNGGHSVTNSGQIRVSGADSIGIEVELVGATDNSVMNSGLIEVLGSAVTGIEVNSNASGVVNTGEIRGGPAAAGILTVGDDVAVRNSGRIFAGTDAFNAGGTDAYLRLDAGSIIVGGIALGAAGTATLDVGLPNAALTLNGVPATILSEGRPQVLLGNVIHVVDADHFAALDRTGWNALDQIDFTLDQGRRLEEADRGRRFWASGALASGADTDGATGMIGATFPLESGRTAGVFAGVQSADYETSFSTSRIDSTSAFAGVTWGGETGWGSFETAVSFGTLGNSSARRVANNLAPSGFEDATGSADGLFVGLSATLGTDMPWRDMTLRPSLRLRYGWQQTDGLVEAGSASNLSTGDRTAQRIDLRARLDADLMTQQTGLGPLALAVFGGFDIGYATADDVTGTVAGGAISFEAPDTGFEAGGFVGGHATLDLRNGASVILSGELGTAGGDGADIRLGAIYSMRF